MTTSDANELSIPSTIDTGRKVVAESEEQPTTITTAFKPFGAITLFNYLTPLSERVDWYRAIMRVFLRNSREYRNQLTAQDILDEVREVIQLNYSLDACKNDLERLVKWGNLTTLYDSSRVTTIADFRSPILRYRATPEALEIEAFLASHAHIGASEGGLHQGDLPRLLEALQQVDRWLKADRATLTPQRKQDIAEQWRQAFTAWESLVNDAAQYLNSMNQSDQQGSSLDAYFVYKTIVVNYIQSFANHLVQHSNAVRAMLADWSNTETKAALLDIVTSTTPPIQALVDNAEAWHEDVRRQIEAFEEWFLHQNNVDMFLKAARDAVERVVQRAHALASSMRPRTDYVTMLHSLASQLMRIDDLEMARQIYAAAFASATPIHLSEGLAGAPAVEERPGERPTWLSPPTVTRTLRAIYKGNIERASEKPMRSNSHMFDLLRQDHDKQVALLQQRFGRLFQHELLDLGEMQSIEPDERATLSEIISACLSSPALEHTLPDGSLVTLLNRDEQNYTILRASDGVLLLPRYRLRRSMPMSVAR